MENDTLQQQQFNEIINKLFNLLNTETSVSSSLIRPINTSSNYRTSSSSSLNNSIQNQPIVASGKVNYTKQNIDLLINNLFPILKTSKPLTN